MLVLLINNVRTENQVTNSPARLALMAGPLIEIRSLAGVLVDTLRVAMQIHLALLKGRFRIRFLPLALGEWDFKAAAGLCADLRAC